MAKLVAELEATQAERAAKALERALADLERGYDKTDQAMDRTKRSSDASAAAFAGVGAAVGVLAADLIGKLVDRGLDVAKRTVVDFTSSLIDTHSTIQTLEIRFGALLGDVEEGARLFDDLAVVAGRIPFELESVMQSAAQLAGVMKGGRNDIVAWLPLIADVAAVSGLSIEQTTDQITRLLTSGVGAARLFRERGVLEVLGFQADVRMSTEETAQTLIDSWESAESRFRGASEQMARTWDGAVSMIQDAWFQFQRTIIEGGLGDELDSIMAVLVEISQDPAIRDLAADIGAALAAVAGWVADNAQNWRAWRFVVLEIAADVVGGLANVIDTISALDLAAVNMADSVSRISSLGMRPSGVAEMFDEMRERAQLWQERAEGLIQVQQRLNEHAGQAKLAWVFHAAGLEQTTAAGDDAASMFDRLRATIAGFRREQGGAVGSTKELADVLKGSLGPALDLVTQRTEEAESSHEELWEATRRVIDDLQPYQREIRKLADMHTTLDAALKAEILTLEEYERLLEVLEERAHDLEDAGRDQLDVWIDLGGAIADAFRGLDSNISGALSSVLQLTGMVQNLNEQWGEMGGMQRAAGGLAIGAQVGGLMGELGVSGGYADTGAMIGALIGAIWGPVGSLVGGALGSVIGSMIGKGQAFAQGMIELIGDELELAVTRDKKGAGEHMRAFGGAIMDTIGSILDALGGELAGIPSVQLKLRGDEIVAHINGLRMSFETMEEAVSGIAAQILKSAEIVGDFDEAFRQFIEGGQFEDVEGLAAGISVLEGLVDLEKRFVLGLSDMEIALEQFNAAHERRIRELEEMGLQEDQILRLTGAARVAFYDQQFRALGIELETQEEREQMRQLQFELLRAELELDIARYAAQREALVAQAEIAQREIELGSNVIDARARFVDNSAHLYRAELDVMRGFTETGLQIIEFGAGAIGGIVGALPEELQSQVDAIDRILDALRGIHARLPDKLPPEIGTLGGGLGDLGNAAGRAADAIGDAVDKIGEQLSGLQQWLESLRVTGPGAGPFNPARQLDILEKQLRDAAAAARRAASGEGDLRDIGRFRQLSDQFLRLSQQSFGSAGGGFASRLGLVEALGQDILAEGNDIMADLLSSSTHIEELTEQQTQAIEAASTRSDAGNAAIAGQVAELRREGATQAADLRRLMDEFARVIAQQRSVG